MYIFAQKRKLTINTHQLYAPRYAPQQASKYAPLICPNLSMNNFVKPCLQLQHKDKKI